MKRGDIWHDGEKEKEERGCKGGKEGRMEETYRGGDFGSLRFAGID